jgi:hypothetical protein
MLRKLAIVLAAAVSLGVAAAPTDVMARAGGGGHGGGGHGGFSGGGRSFSGGAFMNRGVPGGRTFGPGRTFVAPGGGRPLVGRGPANLAGRHIIGGGRYAWIGGHRIHGRHIHGFIPGIGYGYYWYYDDCYVWTDFGWINLCGYDY